MENTGGDRLETTGGDKGRILEGIDTEYWRG